MGLLKRVKSRRKELLDKNIFRGLITYNHSESLFPAGRLGCVQYTPHDTRSHSGHIAPSWLYLLAGGSRSARHRVLRWTRSAIPQEEALDSFSDDHEAFWRKNEKKIYVRVHDLRHQKALEKNATFQESQSFQKYFFNHHKVKEQRHVDPEDSRTN